MPVRTEQKIRFGAFEFDRQTGELYQNGDKLKLQGQPIAVLTLLLERPGELVTRDQLRQHLWPEDTFVDFEHSLNTHIKKLRQVLDDDADAPRYIETLPRRGYRLIAPVAAFPNGSPAVAEPANVASAKVAISDAPQPPPSPEPPPSTQVMPPEPPPPQPTPPPQPQRRKYAAAATVVVAVAAFALYWIYRPRTPVVTGIRQLTNTGRHKTFYGYHQVVSDGTRVYFDEFNEGINHIAQVSTKGGEVSYLDTSLILFPAIAGISSDGSELLLFSQSETRENQFWVFPLPNGPARKLPGMFQWMQYLPSSDQYVYVSDGQLFAENRDSTDAHRLMVLPKGLSSTGDLNVDFSFSISPDGKRTRFSEGGGKMWESQLNGSGLRRFLPEHKGSMCCGNWSPDGTVFVFGSADVERNNLWTVTERGFPFYRLDSPPIQLTNGPVPFRFSTFSKAGNQIFAMGETMRGELSVHDAKSGEFRPYFNGISAGYIDFSRDGQWATYVTYPEGTLWRSRVDGSQRMPLISPPNGTILLPKWSPDGRFIVFMSWDNTFLERKIYIVPADGGAPLLLLSGDSLPTDPTWSPDGKSIAYGGAAGVGSAEIRILNLETKQSRSIPGSQGMFSPRWSPDGRYIVAESSDQRKLLLYSFETDRWKELPYPPIPPLEGFGWPTWSHDSRYVYSECHARVYRIRVPDGIPEAVADVQDMKLLSVGWFGLTPDDRVLVLRDRGFDELYALDLEYR